MKMIQRVSVVLCVLMMVSACGFEPIYRAAQRNIVPRDMLSQIEIITPAGRQGDQLKARMEDYFYAGGVRQGNRYRLQTDLSIQSQPFLIEPDGIASRFNVLLVSNYTLYRSVDNLPLKKGVIRRHVSYNVSEADDYSTFISERDAVRQGIDEMADEYKLRIAAIFAKSIDMP